MLRGPVSGATPISPQNGASGTWIPGQYSVRPDDPGTAVILYSASGKSSARSPNPGMFAVQPQPRGLQLEDVDLERVTGLGPDDLDRSVHLVDPLEVERAEVGGRRRLGELPVRGIEAVERDDLTGADGCDGRDGRVPGEMRPVPSDVDGRGDHGRPSDRGRRPGRARPASDLERSWGGDYVDDTAPASPSLSPIASRTERSLSRSRNHRYSPMTTPISIQIPTSGGTNE